jgi:hypothetical protein
LAGRRADRSSGKRVFNREKRKEARKYAVISHRMPDAICWGFEQEDREERKETRRPRGSYMLVIAPASGS